jgi:hypothetical protein
MSEWLTPLATGSIVVTLWIAWIAYHDTGRVDRHPILPPPPRGGPIPPRDQMTTPLGPLGQWRHMGQCPSWDGEPCNCSALVRPTPPENVVIRDGVIIPPIERAQEVESFRRAFEEAVSRSSPVVIGHVKTDGRAMSPEELERLRREVERR